MATAVKVNYGALSRHARETIKAAGWLSLPITIAGYVRHWYPDGVWGGDTCGCVDDRCIGHHHDADEDCGCLEALLDQYFKVVEATAMTIEPASVTV